MKKFLIILITLLILSTKSFANTKEVNISTCVNGGSNLNWCALQYDDFDCRTDKQYFIKFWSGTAGYMNCIEFDLENNGTRDQVPYLYYDSSYPNYAIVSNLYESQGANQLRIYRTNFVSLGGGNYRLEWIDRTDTIDLTTPSNRFNQLSLYSRTFKYYSVDNSGTWLMETNVPYNSVSGSLNSSNGFYGGMTWMYTTRNFTGYYGNLLNAIAFSNTLIQTANYVPNVPTLDYDVTEPDITNSTIGLSGSGNFMYTGADYQAVMWIYKQCTSTTTTDINISNPVAIIEWTTTDDRTSTEYNQSADVYYGAGYTPTSALYSFDGVKVPYDYPSNCTYPTKYAITDRSTGELIYYQEDFTEIIPPTATSNIIYENPTVEPEYTGIFSGVINWFKGFINNLIGLDALKVEFDVMKGQVTTLLKSKAPFKYVYDIFEFDWSDITESSTFSFNFTALGQTMNINGVNSFTNAIVPVTKTLLTGLMTIEFVVLSYFMFKSLL